MMIIGLSFIIYHLSFSHAVAQHYGYSDERPLVIGCDWDFQPFEFLNADGKPSGYNVEVLDVILTKLNIPHKFVMREWHNINEMFAERKADIIHALSYNFKGHPYVTTKKYINYYTLRVARNGDTPPLTSYHQLKEGDTLLLKQDDYAALALRDFGEQPFAVEYTSPKSALSRISNGQARYFVWGELPLKRKIQELHFDGIVLDEIDLPAGELRIIGYDHNIISLIDEEFTRLEQAGEIQPIYDRWFRPELVHDNASPWAPYLLVGLLIALFVAFILSHLITVRVKKAVRQSADINKMMIQALDMGDYHVIVYDLRSHLVKNMHGSLMPSAGMPIDEFINRIAPDQREEFRENVQALARGEVEHWTMTRRWNTNLDGGEPKWQTFYGSALLEREYGQPRYIIHTVKNISREVAEEAHNQDLTAKYKVLFETNILAMSFYDKDGHLMEANQKMRELCFTNETSRQYFYETNLFDFPGLKEDFDISSREPFNSCYHPQLKGAGIDCFVENRIVPLYDDNDQLLFYIVTTRDITAERQMYLQLREHERKLIETNQAIRRYDNQLSYLLEESKIFVWHYDPKTDTVHFSHKPHVEEYTESLNKLMEGVPEKHRAAEVIKIRDYIAKCVPFKIIHEYSYTPIHHEHCWFAISGMPTFDENGKLKEFFGMARNVTQLMLAQEHLRQETERAENSGKLKGAFLANMTHEIRTPLNAIVGFSEILQMVDTPEERLEFIRIIRNNCDMLLRLINDILEASSMGQSLAIEPKKLDLAHVFDDICLALEQRVQDCEGVAFVKDNPYSTYPAVLDAGRLQQLLTNFVTNAVKYTKQGHIKVGYHEENGGIYFYCEDTGAGIPKEHQASIFERFVKLNDFVQGTGLGLSICRAIVKKCGGKIGVKSEGEGHGSTFWFWIPREIKA